MVLEQDVKSKLGGKKDKLEYTGRDREEKIAVGNDKEEATGVLGSYLEKGGS